MRAGRTGWRWRFAVAVVASVVASLACSAAAAQPAAPARLATCLACHGADGQSAVPLSPSLAAQPRVFLENTLVLIREGLRDVPVMKGLLDGASDAELVALAAHFAQLPPPSSGVVADAARARRGAELARRGLCANCHESDYRGRAQIPRLAQQREDYLLAGLRLFRSGVTPGRDSIMSATVHGLTDVDLADLAHYLATFSPPRP